MSKKARSQASKERMNERKKLPPQALLGSWREANAFGLLGEEDLNDMRKMLIFFDCLVITFLFMRVIFSFHLI
jgi:hypothetical protein